MAGCPWPRPLILEAHSGRQAPPDGPRREQILVGWLAHWLAGWLAPGADRMQRCSLASPAAETQDFFGSGPIPNPGPSPNPGPTPFISEIVQATLLTGCRMIDVRQAFPRDVRPRGPLGDLRCFANPL